MDWLLDGWRGMHTHTDTHSVTRRTEREALSSSVSVSQSAKDRYYGHISYPTIHTVPTTVMIIW
jgi:hypothetical protein